MTLLRSRLFLRLGLLLAICCGLLADTTSYTYDDAGRLTQVTYPNGKSITYTYDKAGNLLSRQVAAAGGSSLSKKEPTRKIEHKEERRAK